MRIWTLHPKYLDAKGLVAVWRETLLAQKVLKGETKGYRHHPQLERFNSQALPVAAISTYLHHICDEAVRRGYQFDRAKIELPPISVQILSTEGQLRYEWKHLREKLRKRATEKYRELSAIQMPAAHPLFKVVAGEVEPWEVSKA